MSKLDFLARLDGVAQAELVRRGELSAVDLVDACAQRIDRINPLIHALTVTDLERARERAARGVTGPFAGVPFLIKDVVGYPGMRWSAGSRLLAGNSAAPPSPFTQRVDEAGLITLGKTTTSEFGLLGSTETLLEGITHNPWALARSAAGSSGGAAAAVAAGLVPLAHASDGGGSTRIPASVCGLFGFKPSRRRCVPTSSGGSDFEDLVADLCVSRSVRDSALLLSVTEVRGEGAAYPPIGYVRAPAARRLRVGLWSATLMGAEPEAEVAAALGDAARLCAELGHAVRQIAPPPIDGASLSDAFFVTAAAAVGPMTQMVAQLRQRPLSEEDLEPFTRALLEDLLRRPPGALEAARRAFAQAAARYLEVFADLDVILTPTLAVEPWLIGELSPLLDRATLIRRTERAVGYTPIHNITGCPAMSVPLHWTEAGLPIGVHFAARLGEDALLLALAYELEAARPWAARWAPCSYPVLAGA